MILKNKLKASKNSLPEKYWSMPTCPDFFKKIQPQIINKFTCSNDKIDNIIKEK